MKQSVKRALDSLRALGFHGEPHAYKANTSSHWHANEPETRLTVWAGMSDAAASKVVAHAEAIVGLASTETSKTEKKAKAQGAAKRREEAERLRNIEATRRLAAKKEREAEETRRRQFLARQNRGQLTDADRLVILGAVRGEWIDPLRISDELCIGEPTVRAAINSGALDAYRVGKRVLCKTREVVQWVKAGMPIEVAS